MTTWSILDVSDWLASLELNDYILAFSSNEISGAELKSLSDADLNSMGVTKIGHRKKILTAINPNITQSSNNNDSESTPKSSSKSTLAASSGDASVITIKATYKGEMRKMKLASGSRLSDLKAEVTSKFPDLKGSKFVLTYEDADGDNLALGSEGGKLHLPPPLFLLLCSLNVLFFVVEWEECLEENPKSVKVNIGAGSSSSSSSKSSSSKSAFLFSSSYIVIL